VCVYDDSVPLSRAAGAGEHEVQEDLRTTREPAEQDTPNATIKNGWTGPEQGSCLGRQVAEQRSAAHGHTT
jgi:hypothetical protein